MKYKGGSVVATASGSVGGLTMSRNRYGQYIRIRAIPTKVSNENTMSARARLIQVSQAWGLLTSAQQRAWAVYADSAPITDALGDKQVLTPHAAYVQINARVVLAGGTILTAPPSAAAPPSLTACTGTWDIGAGTSTLAYTVTPLAANHCLYVQAAVLIKPGQRYWKNRIKLIKVSAAALASPYDWQADTESRFGALVIGQRVVLLASVLDKTTGLISAPAIEEGVVVSTV